MVTPWTHYRGGSLRHHGAETCPKCCDGWRRAWGTPWRGARFTVAAVPGARAPNNACGIELGEVSDPERADDILHTEALSERRR